MRSVGAGLQKTFSCTEPQFSSQSKLTQREILSILNGYMSQSAAPGPTTPRTSAFKHMQAVLSG